MTTASSFLAGFHRRRRHVQLRPLYARDPTPTSGTLAGRRSAPALRSSVGVEAPRGHSRLHPPALPSSRAIKGPRRPGRSYRWCGMPQLGAGRRLIKAKALGRLHASPCNGVVPITPSPGAEEDGETPVWWGRGRGELQQFHHAPRPSRIAAPGRDVDVFIAGRLCRVMLCSQR